MRHSPQVSPRQLMDAVVLHAFIIDCEQCKAQQFLLVQSLDNLHRLLVHDRLCSCKLLSALILFFDLGRRVLLLEVLDLVVAELLPHLEPIDVIVGALLAQRLPAIGVSLQAAALVGAHVGEPALVLTLEGGVVVGVPRVCEELGHRRGVVVLGALHQGVETLTA